MYKVIHTPAVTKIAEIYDISFDNEDEAIDFVILQVSKSSYWRGRDFETGDLIFTYKSGDNYSYWRITKNPLPAKLLNKVHQDYYKDTFLTLLSVALIVSSIMVLILTYPAIEPYITYLVASPSPPKTINSTIFGVEVINSRR
jgi:hypothetical protein